MNQYKQRTFYLRPIGHLRTESGERTEVIVQKIFDELPVP